MVFGYFTPIFVIFVKWIRSPNFFLYLEIKIHNFFFFTLQFDLSLIFNFLNFGL